MLMGEDATSWSERSEMSLWQYGELFPDRRAKLLENPALEDNMIAVFCLLTV